jgi:hypothetical protein
MEGKIETGNLHISGVTHFWQLFPLTNNLVRCTIVIMMISLSTFTVFDNFIKVFDNIIEKQICLNYNPVLLIKHLIEKISPSFDHIFIHIQQSGINISFCL